EENEVGIGTFQTGFILDALGEEAYRAFEISGNSMDDGSIGSIPNKAIVLGLKLDKMALVKESNALWNKPYILICKDRIICKWVTGVNGQENSIFCQNLNKSPEYQDFELAFEDVLQVFKITRKQV
ncbi:MAG: hypothetical protein ABJN28_03875, partial [Flavobacteriaceae bacterium]